MGEEDKERKTLKVEKKPRLPEGEKKTITVKGARKAGPKVVSSRGTEGERPQLKVPSKAPASKVKTEVVGKPAHMGGAPSAPKRPGTPARTPPHTGSPTPGGKPVKPLIGKGTAPPFIPSYLPGPYGRIRTFFRPLYTTKQTGGSANDLMTKLNIIESRLRGIGNVVKGMNTIFKKECRIRPGYSSSWIIPNPPIGVKKITEFLVDRSKVTLYKLPNQTENLYHLTPYEYRLGEKHIKLLAIARRELIEHYPTTLQLDKPEQAREYVVSYAKESLYKLAMKHKISLGKSRKEERDNIDILSDILAKYTAGMGIAEIFLKDKYVQDIYIDAPTYENPVYVNLEGFEDPDTGATISGKYVTNVILSESDAESLLSRFRYESGRPFSEAMPVLECDLDAYNTRVTIIGSPLSPQGIAFALRRHSTDPWTLPKLIYHKSLTPLTAGLLSFLVDGRSTVLVTGSRGAGKTSLLGAIMLELPQSQRILTIEDTLELPAEAIQSLGYKVQSMHVQSSLGGQSEMTADEALRVALRLGESAIVMGEVRGQEAKTLYEAMRAGTAGSTVLGTIHANSAKAVYERVVHDMNIPSKSFEATDVVVVAGLIRPAGIQRNVRRVTQVAELRTASGAEGDFADLLVYDERLDRLKETDAFKYNSEKIGEIAGNWGMTMEEALENIEARAKIREILVAVAKRTKNMDLLKAKWVANSNNTFWTLLEQHYSRSPRVDYKRLVEDWKTWFKESVKNA